MEYSLAKELKDAGFVSKNIISWPDSISGDEEFPNPTLSELIEALGNNFYQLEHSPGTWWIARGTNEGVIYRESKADTPLEAVARLWLALHAPEVKEV